MYLAHHKLESFLNIIVINIVGFYRCGGQAQPRCISCGTTYDGAWEEGCGPSARPPCPPPGAACQVHPKEDVGGMYVLPTALPVFCVRQCLRMKR